MLLEGMQTSLTFIRRLGMKLQCNSTAACPDILELSDGSFAVIGSDITHEAGKLPSDAGCGPDERIIRIPRELLARAKRDIPDAM